MDFKKVVNASILPIIVLAVLGVLTSIVSIALSYALPFVGAVIALIISLASFALSCLVLGWAGYSAVKKHHLDLAGAAITGALAAVISAVINSIVSLVLSLLGLVPELASSPIAESVAVGGVSLLIWFIGLVIGVGISVVLGAVLGTIGGYIAERR